MEGNPNCKNEPSEVKTEPMPEESKEEITGLIEGINRKEAEFLLDYIKAKQEGRVGEFLLLKIRNEFTEEAKTKYIDGLVKQGIDSHRINFISGFIREKVKREESLTEPSDSIDT